MQPWTACTWLLWLSPWCPRLGLTNQSIRLKGQCHEIFCFWFFLWIIVPQAPENNNWVISNFYTNSRRYLQVKVQIATGINDAGCKFGWQKIETACLHLKVNLKEKNYLYVNSTTQRCLNKIIKTFLIEDFPFVTGVNDTGAPWAANISTNIRKYLKRPKRDTQVLGRDCFREKKPEA